MQIVRGRLNFQLFTMCGLIRKLIKVSSACGGTSVREAGPEFGPQGDETVQ
jgi:hypothetical protein